jgi:hypothetical protein
MSSNHGGIYRVGDKIYFFLDFFFRFSISITVKMSNFLIPTVKFEFKCTTWTNLELSPSYSPSVPTASGTVVDTDWARSNMAGITRPGRALTLQATGPATSAEPGITNHRVAATDPGIGGSIGLSGLQSEILPAY